MSEIVSLLRWLATSLKEDDATAKRVTDRVYSYPAPAKAARPYVVIRTRPGRDRRPLNGVGGIGLVEADIVAVGDGNDLEALEPVADRIDELFGGIRTTAAGMLIRGRRELPIVEPEVLMGTNRFSRLGGSYRFWVSPVS